MPQHLPDHFRTKDHALNITETDLAIASALYTVLVGYVREAPERRLTYGALLNDAKARFPNSDPVRMAIPVSLGRRLDVVRMFLNEQKLPDLTSLVVNAGTGEVGSAFGGNPEQVRAEVAAFDWSAVSEDFDLHIEGLRKEIQARARPKLKRDAAKKVMFEYYRANASALPKDIKDQRDLIIQLLCDGLPADEAFESAMT